MDLLQLGTYGSHANLAHACGWEQPGRSDHGCDQRLVPTHFAGRQMDGVSLLWEGCHWASAGPKCRVEPDVDERQIGACACKAVWWTGNDECTDRKSTRLNSSH